jgi:hypothetical protein
VGALLGGLAIGAVAGGVSYALQHRGQPIACFLRDPNFWRAVAVGGVSGTVSGFVAGFFAPLMLLSSGVGTAMQIGGFIGMLSAFSGHVVTNLLYGRPVAEGLGWAMLSGAVFGALGGALGYWARTTRPQPTSQPGTGNGSTPKVPGDIVVDSDAPSTKLLQNYYPKNGSIEFIFDPETHTFAAGKPASYLGIMGSPHQQLARSVGANESTVLGGEFARGGSGTIITNEYSGHYGARWTLALRQQFVDFLEQMTHLPVQHSPF